MESIPERREIIFRCLIKCGIFVVGIVRLLSRVRLFVTPWVAAPQASLSFTISRSMLTLMSTKSVMPSNHFFRCYPFFLLASIFHSISLSNEYSGPISFRMDWLDLLAVQGILMSLLQHHSSKVSILQDSAFFILQLSHPYMTTGKTKTLTRWILVGKVMSLLFNMLSKLVIAFLPRSKHLLILWLQSPSAVILELKKIKSDTVLTVSPSICHEVLGPDAMILLF